MVDDKAKQDLMRQLGIDQLPLEEREKKFAEIGGVIFQKVMFRAMDILKEEDKKELDRMITENPQDVVGVIKFLNDKIPNLRDIVNQEAKDFQDDAMDVMGRIK